MSGARRFHRELRATPAGFPQAMYEKRTRRLLGSHQIEAENTPIIEVDRPGLKRLGRLFQENCKVDF